LKKSAILVLVAAVAAISLFLTGCPPQTVCGDGTCDTGENFNSCPDDCGVCRYPTDCGVAHPTGDAFCNVEPDNITVQQNYVNYRCTGSGTPDAECENYTYIVQIDQCEEGCEDGQCIQTCDPACFDSDNGNNTFVRAYVNVTLADCSRYSRWDTCYNNDVVNELICVAGSMVNTTAYCENGCAEGRCK